MVESGACFNWHMDGRTDLPMDELATAARSLGMTHALLSLCLFSRNKRMRVMAAQFIHG